MRTKKSNLMYYVIGALIVAAFVFVLVRETPMAVEHVEQPLTVTLEP